MLVKLKLLSIKKYLIPAFGLVFLMSSFSIGHPQVGGGGSCDLEDLMRKFAKEKQLISEVEAQMKAQNVTKARCWAKLLYLADRSHSRVAPYEIDIGSKTLTIFSKIILLSKSGERLPDGAFDQAYDFEEVGITWEWN